MGWELVARHISSGEERRARVTLDHAVIVGRAEESPLKFTEQGVSRAHFTLERASGETHITDRSGLLGTRLNDSPLTRNEPRVLKSGDRIGMGDWEITFLGLPQASAAGSPISGAVAAFRSFSLLFSFQERVFALAAVAGCALVLAWFTR
jgi:predicted component of type VI protein secretion system